ncbi:apolipoprotein N-acyltransferase [Desulfatibacillum aliphaticivorans]|uniref:apolipoprotein N-acyltransferase n=1 Tax=Desulfatibacillum aliphaticivorans TaxID=218208 RepID=UPI0003FD8655|nr:apolipoprotein N-acyltransferase [Desulfatibacillum aliphaticivorans]
MAVFFKESIKGPLIRLMAAMCSGVLLTLAYPQADLWWIAWFAFLPLLFAVRNKSWSAAFGLGFLTGLIHNIGLVYWVDGVMRQYGGIPWYASFPLLFLLAVYLSVYMGLFAAFTRKGPVRPLRSLFFAPALWVCLEYARTYLITGFPWGLLGHTQYQNLEIIQIADLTGAYGVSALIILVNYGLYLLGASLYSGTLFGPTLSRTRGMLAILLTGMIVGGAYYYGVLRLDQVKQSCKNAEAIEVAVIQGNIDQNIKWNPAYQEHTVDTYVRLTKSAVSPKTELAIWPESAMPFYFSATEPFLTARVLNEAREDNLYLLTGSMSFERTEKDPIFYNSAFLIGQNGKVLGKYDKAHLVPWGEYVPLKKYMPFINNLVEQVSDFSPGRKGEALPANGVNLGVLICYEIIFPSLARHQVLDGANLLVTITNDAWFGRSSAPYQHFSTAVFRAVENRRAVARAANTGVSGFIDPTGKILAATNLFVEDTRTTSLPLLKTGTLYTELGDLFAFICMGLVIILMFAGPKTK